MPKPGGATLKTQTSVERHCMSDRAKAARARLQQKYDADLRAGKAQYGRGDKTVYPRGPKLPHRRHPQAPTRVNAVPNPKRRISRAAADTLATARFERHDISTFTGKSHKSLEEKARRLGRRIGKIPNPDRALNPVASYGAVQFRTRSLRHVGEGAQFVLVTGEVAVPVEDLPDFMRDSDHTLVFHKAPVPKVISKADAAITIQRRARGFLTRAMRRRQQAAALILQRQARRIAARVFVHHLQECAGAALRIQCMFRGREARRAFHSKVVGSEPTRVGGAWESSDSQDSPKVVGSEPTRASDAEGGVDTVPYEDGWEVINREDLPSLPTLPCGTIDFTCLDLELVELVSFSQWKERYSQWKMRPGGSYDNFLARTSLMTRFTRRQLSADRILTLYNWTTGDLMITGGAIIENLFLTREDRQEARARGFTRICYYEREWDDTPEGLGDAIYTLVIRDKRDWE